MKSPVFAILLLVAGAFALPQIDDSAKSGIVEQRIEVFIERLSGLIRLFGWDPLEVDARSQYAPLPGIFEVNTHVEDLKLTGLSNIAINYLDFNVLLARLRFEFSLPELHLTIGNSGVDIILLEHVDNISLSGSLAVRGVTLAGEISFNTSWEDGITVRSITLDLSFGRTESDLKLIAFDKNYSEPLNSLLGEIIPRWLERFGNEINRFLEVIVRRILDFVL